MFLIVENNFVCPFCEKTKTLLLSKNKKFKIIKFNQDKKLQEVEKDVLKSKIKKDYNKTLEKLTVPQIFFSTEENTINSLQQINDIDTTVLKYIGGYSELINNELLD